MDYRIAQDEKYLGNDYWQWSAWIVGKPEALDRLDRVIWILHPTFSPPRVESRNRETGFRLETSGWGTFRLAAELYRKDDRKPIVVSRSLELTYPGENQTDVPANSAGTEAVPSRRSPYVFLSYSSEDAVHAGAVKESMRRLGVDVRDAREVKSGMPFDAAVRKLIRESDGVLSIVGGDFVSPSVITEMTLAQAEGKPASALMPEGVDLPSGFSSTVALLRLDRDSKKMDSLLGNFAQTLNRA